MIYAMSDIHGCIEELQKQMEQVDLSGKNRIIFLGDYIDYGDSSCQVLEYIRDLQKDYGKFYRKKSRALVRLCYSFLVKQMSRFASSKPEVQAVAKPSTSPKDSVLNILFVFIFLFFLSMIRTSF